MRKTNKIYCDVQHSIYESSLILQTCSLRVFFCIARGI